MNDLFTQSWSSPVATKVDEECKHAPGLSTGTFNKNARNVTSDLKQVKQKIHQLVLAHDSILMAATPSAVEEALLRLEQNVVEIQSAAKQIKEQIEVLQTDNMENRRIPGCGPGSVTERHRSNITQGLNVSLTIVMTEFAYIRDKMDKNRRSALRRRFRTATGEKLSSKEIDDIVDSGRSEEIFRAAIIAGGQEHLRDVLIESSDRRATVADIERSILELQQMFLEISLLVETQGEVVNEIEENVKKATEYTEQVKSNLRSARKRFFKKKQTQQVVAATATSTVLVCVVTGLLIVLL